MFAPLSGPRRPGHLKRPGRGPLLGQSIRVRPLEARDEAAVFALYAAVIDEGSAFLAAPDELGPPRPLGPGAGLVAEITAEDGVLGAILLQTPPFARLRHSRTLELFVGAEQRGGGVGGALLDAAIGLLRTQPALRWLRLSVYADNDAAVALYSARGFVEEGRRRAFAVEAGGRERDELLMALELRPPGSAGADPGHGAA